MITSGHESDLSESVSTFSTIPELCLAAIHRHAKADALNHKRAGEWLHINAETFIERVRAITLRITRADTRRLMKA